MTDDKPLERAKRATNEGRRVQARMRSGKNDNTRRGDIPNNASHPR